MWNRIAALTVVLATLMAYGMRWGGEALARAGVFLVLPLAAVWFPHAMGAHFSVNYLYGSINRTSPPGCVHAIGWLLLLMPLVQFFVR